MLKISRLADYAVILLVKLGEDGDVVTCPVLSSVTGIPEPTVAKILKLASAQGLVYSRRGTRGGYGLTKPLDKTTMASVITAVDGNISLTACADGDTTCEVANACKVSRQWCAINKAIQNMFENITLEHMRSDLGDVCSV